MTIKYKNVFLNETATTAGPIESEGPLNVYYDKTIEEFYDGAKTFEQAEIKFTIETNDILTNKAKIKKNEIDLFISGDLLNQITSSSHVATNLKMPYLGIYAACATSIEGIIIGSTMIEGNFINNAIISTSSHNNTAERQFRYPVEYGGPKPLTQTFTTTGSAQALLSNKKRGLKIESTTTGIPVDSNTLDTANMGAVMAIAAAETIKKHLTDLKREPAYYDLILTGDLGKYGLEMVIDVLKNEYNYDTKNINDSACLIYDIENQDVYAGGSGPACLPLVAYSFIKDEMINKRLNKVLLVATGALMSPTTVNQKLTIPSIAHAVSLETI